MNLELQSTSLNIYKGLKQLYEFRLLRQLRQWRTFLHLGGIRKRNAMEA